MEWANRPALKAKGTEAVIVAMYLMTCQHANMLGLYHLNPAYITADTGLPLEGALKGLRSACEAGFAGSTRTAWWCGSSKWPATAAAQLEAKDNRCKGIQREYEGLPENPYLEPFYEKYGAVFT